MSDIPEGLAPDTPLLEVVEELHRIAQSRESLFARIVRQALDEVIDGPRTGRWALSQLSKTEKTYVGTKIEILLRSELGLEPGSGVGVDVLIAGHEVDIKWSRSLGWMIGPENVDKICIGLGLGRGERTFSVGVFRATQDSLRDRANRDGKFSLTSEARRDRVTWLLKDAALPINFVAELPADLRQKIFAGQSAQERIRLLGELVPMTLIPREAFETVAGNKADAMRRLRQDAAADDGLGNIVWLSTKYGRQELEALGMRNLPKDHWVAVPKDRVSRPAI